MFYSIAGAVAHSEPNLVVIDTGGVSYAIMTSLTTQQRVRKGERALLYTHMYLRDDICDLYGFATREELATFRQLLGISGVGPKAALAVLSVGSPEKLALAIITGDERVLTAAPGVGKKLAQRIILELKDKLGREQSAAALTDHAVYAPVGEGGKLTEAQAALTVLGYTPTEAAMALKGLDLDELPLEEIIRRALRRMM